MVSFCTIISISLQIEPFKLQLYSKQADTEHYKNVKPTKDLREERRQPTKDNVTSCQQSELGSAKKENARHTYFSS